MSDITSVKLEQLNWEGCQTRVRVDEATVDYYAERIKCGDAFPPLVLFSENGHSPYYVGDGVHRLLANESLGNGEVKARIFQGGEERARLYSATVANYNNGLPLTPEDKRNRVREVLSLKPSWSLNRVAEECKVGWGLVSRLASAQREPASSPSKQGSPPKNKGETKKPRKKRRPNFVEGSDGKKHPARKPKKPPKNGAPKTSVATKKDAWKVYSQLCRVLTDVGLDEALLTEMDKIGSAIQNL